MEKEFITYEAALALKELGFNELCFGWYRHKSVLGNEFNILEFEKCKNIESWITGKHCSAPLYQQAFKWFREKHKLHNYVRPHWHFVVVSGFCYVINDYTSSVFKTYEEAELACLRKLIELVKNK